MRPNDVQYVVCGDFPQHIESGGSLLLMTSCRFCGPALRVGASAQLLPPELACDMIDAAGEVAAVGAEWNVQQLGGVFPGASRGEPGVVQRVPVPSCTSASVELARGVTQ